MTSKLKSQFNDCLAEIITIDTESVIVTSFTGERDPFTDDGQGENGIISDTKSL